MLIVHIEHGARSATRNERRVVFDTLREWENSMPCWNHEWVPEFSAADWELLGVYGVEVPAEHRIVPEESPATQLMRKAFMTIPAPFCGQCGGNAMSGHDAACPLFVDTLEKNIRDFHDWQGGLYE